LKWDLIAVIQNLVPYYKGNTIRILIISMVMVMENEGPAVTIEILFHVTGLG
jgi:hypothetical protein